MSVFQVKAIIGESFPWELISKDVDCKLFLHVVCVSMCMCMSMCAHAVPELQGEPEDVAIEKCKIATQTVNF